jgi:menaquinone-dependent protoporphyrinogen oxidase
MNGRRPQAPRRAALQRIAITLAAFTAAGAGLVSWGLFRPPATILRSACTGGSMNNKRVLVAYATRAGSTAEVAQAVAQRLCAAGFDAEVRPVEDVKSLDGFDAVVLGSAIRYSAWLPEVLKFAASQRIALNALPLAIFTLHMQALDDNPAARETRAKYTQPLRALLTPRDEAFFAGKVDPATLSFFERLAVRMVKSPVGDKRDWGRIRDWADGLAQRLR